EPAGISALEHAWASEARWNGITRPYNAGDVYRLRGSIDIEYSLARYGAARLWELLRDEDYVPVLSAITGNQAIQQVQAGLKAIYVSGWQVAADANRSEERRVGEECRRRWRRGQQTEEQVQRD